MTRGISLHPRALFRLPWVLRAHGRTRPTVGMLSDVAPFGVITEFTQELRHEPQREPEQDGGGSGRDDQGRRDRINQPRRYFVQLAHSVTFLESIRSLFLTPFSETTEVGHPLLHAILVPIIGLLYGIVETYFGVRLLPADDLHSSTVQSALRS